MPNHHRGEIGAVLDGRPHTLCLTLGALAELEAAFGDENILALAERFEGGKLAARDLVRIIGAGLRGAGHDIDDAAVARMKADGGIAGFIDIAARLLTATFSPAPGPSRDAAKGSLPPPPCGEGRGGGSSRDRDPAAETPPVGWVEPTCETQRLATRDLARSVPNGSPAAPATLATAPTHEVPAPGPFPGPT